MGIISWIVVGAIAGWLASLVMKTNAQQGLLMDIIVGIVGGLIGGFLLGLLDTGADVSGINLTSILVAFLGAVVLLAILRVVRRG
ncbi:MAG: GlsB/YeaQ/YmgE family stress response membrane protein [Anaerolineae bacterium]|nr:GlsB/YeaQ/YmgE family stress response membrane protein [Anaerolineae bacterium]